ncbi:MAG: hypothetical protein HQ546_10820 [Planctomycetes bacterium]|nr:hypothetical protein [Planctomycetota bacterium]
MAYPTFNGTALVTEGQRCGIGSAQARVHVEALPGVNGVYAQLHGYGGRQIAVSGLIVETAATAAAALAAVMSTFRSREAMIDGDTVADFVGTDGHTYSNCLLQSYTHGGTQVAKVGANTYEAYLPIQAQLLQLTP